MKRDWEIDALRGLMLVLMTVTHLPTRLSSPLGQPLGFVSAAEGFVLFSAYMAGLVYARVALKSGIESMRSAFWRRALKVYACHAALLLFLFTVIAAVGVRIDQPAVKDLMSFYLAQPHTALGAGLLLIYAPPLLDILPMYILFMLASPWLLAYALRRGWGLALGSSLAAWLLAQFGLGRGFYEAAAAVTGLPVPFNETGSFSPLAWQLLWIVGLWMGAIRTVERAQAFVFPGWAVVLAVLIVATGISWRHAVGQVPFGNDAPLNGLFDKWLLGPLRLLNLLALITVTLRFGPWLAARLPRLPWLETLGAASLPVFCAHLMIVLLVLALFGSNPQARAWWVDTALLAASFTALYGVASVTLWLDRLQELKRFAATAAAPEDATQAPTSTTGSRLR